MRPATALRTALLVAVTVFGSLTTIVSTTVAAPADAAPRLPTFPIGAAQYTVNVNKPGGPGGYVFYTTGLPAAVPLPIAPQALAGIDQSAIIADKSGRSSGATPRRTTRASRTFAPRPTRAARCSRGGRDRVRPGTARGRTTSPTPTVT